MRTINFMLKAIFYSQLLIAILLLAAVCAYGQTFQAFQPAYKDGDLKPGAKVEVRKYTDDKGRLVRYDSVYTYTWSSKGENPVKAGQAAENIGHAGAAALPNQGNSWYSFYFNRDIAAEMQRLHQQMIKSIDEWLKISRPVTKQPASPAEPQKNKVKNTVITM